MKQVEQSEKKDNPFLMDSGSIDINYVMQWLKENASSNVLSEAEKLVEMARSGTSIGTLSGVTEKDMEALYSMAYTLYQNGAYKQAKNIFFYLYSFNGSEKRFIVGLASTLYMLKDYQQALILYLSTFQIDPDDPVVYSYIGDTYLKMYAYEDSKSIYEIALEKISESNLDFSTLKTALEKKIDIVDKFIASQNES